MPTLTSYPALAAFLEKQLAGVLALPVAQDGTIHAAALRYVHTPKPLRFYFITDRSTEKCHLLLDGQSVPAAYVVGTEVDVPFSLQLRGAVQMVDKRAYPEVAAAYVAKQDRHGPALSDHGNVLLQFVPSWARFTDYTKGYDRNFLKLGD